MATFERYEPGQFCWVDYVAHDMKAARAFYSKIFGWTPVEQDTRGGPPYTMFQRNGRDVAGLGQMSDEMIARGIPPLWNSYVSVEDAAATEAEAKALGATITVGAMDAVDAGRMMYFVDPVGAQVAVWQPKKHFGAGLANEPGAFAWHELACRDIATAEKFYGELFGWTYEDVEGPMKMRLASNAGRNNATHIEMNEEWGDMPSHWMVYFAVEDADDTAKEIETLGGSVSVPPTDIPPGRFSVVRDPQGGLFTIIRLANP
jgi:predicted enzyme related to lactoylglutathione lyase